MRFIPHDYQRRAVDFIIDHPRCFLFLDMGLGKSVITLSAIETLARWGMVRRVLVVAPKRVAESTWTAEAAKWDHLTLTTAAAVGTPAKRRRAIESGATVTVTGRDTVAGLCAERELSELFDMVVVDELTGFKDPSAKRTKALVKATAGVARVVGLTGTPAPNGVQDLFGEALVVDGGERLGRHVTKFRDRWLDIVTRNNIPVKIRPKPGALEGIMRILSDISLTMTAEEYLKLPERIDVDVEIPLPGAILARYRRFRREMVLGFIEENEGTEKPIVAASAAALCNKLAQMANGCVYDDDGGMHDVHDCKLDRLEEIVESAGSPVLCFYQYRSDLARIRTRMEGKCRVRHYRKPEDLDAWNAGETDLLLAHPASTAYGLNMQAGGHVIVWFSTGWNLEHWQQANARLYRQGQTRPVRIYRLIASQTIDVEMAEALDEKKGTQDFAIRLLRKYAKESERSEKSE